MEYFKENETRLEFGGFYESIHSEIIDNHIEYFIESENDLNDTEKEYDDYDFDYQSMYNQYIKQYCKMLSNHIKNEYNLNIDFTDLKLISPKYYNFETDKIECKVSNHKDLISYFKNDNDFLDFLNQATQSYDGYISYYDFNQAINNKDNILMLYIFKYICNEFYDNAYFYDIYIDIELEKEKEIA